MRALLPLTLLLLAGSAVAEDMTPPTIQITDAIARPTPVTAQAGAGYFTVTNTGVADDMLLMVEADFPRVMMHDTVLQDGVARMQHLMSVPVPAGGTVAFEPGGKHIMFMGLKGDPFEEGEVIAATLVFETAGRVEIAFQVTEIPAD